ncbi:GNAT family N-acetyltransferase [Acidisoma sp. S159]|uniref:GNAT family N-acetyltransferase n=1 Tax=Acidisoma sp. S159 TaxID=1747225 RepID=UPI0020B12377|nr:GNAT family N-acetyltransferase [Acidisoma sp. S159]
MGLPRHGTVETAAAPYWRLVQELRPEIKTVVIRRPVDEVVDSLRRTGVIADPEALRGGLEALDRKLEQISARVPGALSVTFAELNDEATCARIFEHCLSLPHDPDWYARAAPLNLQINLPAQMHYYAANARQLQAAARSVGQHTRTKLMSRAVVSNEFTFAQEPLEALLRDGAGLIGEHLIMVGEPPDAIAMKNIPLLQKLEDVGILHITTARQNGRMFGYLVAITAPSLQSDDRTEALHTSFFTSPNAPGLGLKLQRASIAHLREQGVDDVFFRAGTRGAGPRMGALYRRLGAEEFGQIYSLNLKVLH